MNLCTALTEYPGLRAALELARLAPTRRLQPTVLEAAVASFDCAPLGPDLLGRVTLVEHVETEPYLVVRRREDVYALLPDGTFRPVPLRRQIVGGSESGTPVIEGLDGLEDALALVWVNRHQEPGPTIEVTLYEAQGSSLREQMDLFRASA